MTQVGISVMCECATFPFCLFAVLNNRIVLFSSPFSVLSFLNPWFIDCVKEKSKLLTENKKEQIHKVDSQYRLAPCFESTLLSSRYFSWTIQPRRNEIQERWQRVHICDLNRNRYACVKKKHWSTDSASLLKWQWKSTASEMYSFKKISSLKDNSTCWFCTKLTGHPTATIYWHLHLEHRSRSLWRTLTPE